MSDKGWPLEEYPFQILKPIELKKGEPTIGHASSNISQYEEEIERLRKRIKELESKVKPSKKVKIKKLNEKFFEELTKEYRKNKRKP